MIRIRVKGRNDLDIPDEMTAEYEVERDRLTFRFSPGVKSFTLDPVEHWSLMRLVEHLKASP